MVILKYLGAGQGQLSGGQKQKGGYCQGCCEGPQGKQAGGASSNRHGVVAP